MHTKTVVGCAVVFIEEVEGIGRRGGQIVGVESYIHKVREDPIGVAVNTDLIRSRVNDAIQSIVIPLRSQPVHY